MDPKAGKQNVQHRADIVESLRSQMFDASIIELELWRDLGVATLSGHIWISSKEKVSMMWDSPDTIGLNLTAVQNMENNLK